MFSVYDLFCSDVYARQLQRAGVAQNTMAVFRRYFNGDTILIAPGFDALGLYKEFNELQLGKVSEFRYEEFAAYSVQEIANCLPGFQIHQNGAIWIAMVPSAGIVADDHRMADAAAKCLLASIYRSYISVETINKQFLNKQYN